METEQKETGNRWLPAATPDLIAVERPTGWRIAKLSAGVSRLLGIAVNEGVGRGLRRLFQQVTPNLEALAEEVAQEESALVGIPVHFPSGPGIDLVAEVLPGGWSDELKGRQVLFFFRQQAPAETVQGPAAGLVGASAALREVLRKIHLYAPAEAAVVITGETGTGKELVARALHELSPRRARPFVAMNCSAVSEDLLESELFGHEKGAFTGALRTHRGRFERADRGTLFLDEIGDMPLPTQTRLLRVLEEGTIERVGAEEEKRVDVRVVAATHVALEKAVSRGQFRADLYHRLAVLRIHIPPLRDRLEDIPLLVDHFLALYGRKYDRTVRRLTPEAIHLLQSYLWPGNVRELRNVLERVFVESQAEVIGARAFAEWVRERQEFSPGEWGLGSLERRPAEPMIPPYPPLPGKTLIPGTGQPYLEAEYLPSTPRRSSTRPHELDAEEIIAAFRRSGGILSQAARLLGVHRATLYRYLKKLDLRRDDLEK